MKSFLSSTRKGLKGKREPLPEGPGSKDTAAQERAIQKAAYEAERREERKKVEEEAAGKSAARQAYLQAAKDRQQARKAAAAEEAAALPETPDARLRRLGAIDLEIAREGCIAAASGGEGLAMMRERRRRIEAKYPPPPNAWDFPTADIPNTAANSLSSTDSFNTAANSLSSTGSFNTAAKAGGLGAAKIQIAAFLPSADEVPQCGGARPENDVPGGDGEVAEGGMRHQGPDTQITFRAIHRGFQLVNSLYFSKDGTQLQEMKRESDESWTLTCMLKGSVNSLGYSYLTPAGDDVYLKTGGKADLKHYYDNEKKLVEDYIFDFSLSVDAKEISFENSVLGAG